MQGADYVNRKQIVLTRFLCDFLKRFANIMERAFVHGLRSRPVLHIYSNTKWRGAVQRSLFFQALLSGKQEEDTVLPELSWVPLFPSFLCVMHQALHWSDAFTPKSMISWKVSKSQVKWNWRMKWNSFSFKMAISWSDMTLWARMFSVQLPF